jgi:eukaryotic-like serine/threonine-protein kinase
MSDPTTMPVKIGEILASKYRVEGYLGTGAMGVVVAARHIGLGKLRAIKLMKLAYSHEQRSLERFTNEARAAASLTSEHAVTIHDFGKLENGMPYIVMEYLLGQDLYKHIQDRKREPHPVDLATLYVLQACSAIAEAHSVGVIHRDLKPGNLFVTTKSNGAPCIKVLDFGLSKLEPLDEGPRAPLTQSRDVMGTPYYMSPEQMTSTRDVDARTDIWSLGVILYELVTGHRPFDGSALPYVFAAVLERSPRAPSSLQKNVTPALEAVILRCLEKDPKKRTASVRELMEQLEPFAMVDLPPTSQGSANRIPSDTPPAARPSDKPPAASPSDNFTATPSELESTLLTPQVMPPPPKKSE